MNDVTPKEPVPLILPEPVLKTSNPIEPYAKQRNLKRPSPPSL